MTIFKTEKTPAGASVAAAGEIALGRCGSGRNIARPRRLVKGSRNRKLWGGGDA
jgi:hypothetical protein